MRVPCSLNHAQYPMHVPTWVRVEVAGLPHDRVDSLGFPWILLCLRPMHAPCPPGSESKQPPSQSCSRPTTSVPPEGIFWPLPRTADQTCGSTEREGSSQAQRLDSTRASGGNTLPNL